MMELFTCCNDSTGGVDSTPVVSNGARQFWTRWVQEFFDIGEVDDFFRTENLTMDSTATIERLRLHTFRERRSLTIAEWVSSLSFFLKGLFVLATFAWGQTACHSQAVNDRANEALVDVRMKSERAFVYPSCPDDTPIGTNCGLYLKRASTENFRVLFRDRKCAAKASNECETLYQKMVDALLQQRYFAADWKGVALFCDANPGRCDKPIEYELALLDAHNRRVREELLRKESEIEAERMRLQNERVTAARGVLNEVVNAMHNGPKCRSYPSAFSGEILTVCSN